MRPTQDFTAQNLFWMKGRKMPESIKKNSPKSKGEWLNLAFEVENDIAQGTFKFTGVFPSVASGKPALSTSSPADALVLRKINDNIRRAYGIRQTQRGQAVKLALIALAEWTPKGVVSLDLKSCFENITPRKVVEKLRKDARVSTQTIHLLEHFFSRARRFGGNKYRKGLPRGILISSTLAELYLSELDERISRMHGVYVYIRYVDDILVLAARSSAGLLNEISDAISAEGLLLNAAKSKKVDAGCSCAFECPHPAGSCPCQHKCSCDLGQGNLRYIDYLGYRLIFPTGENVKDNVCYAMIAKGKAERTKKRIASSITHFKKHNNYRLLVDCIRYLTTNITVDRARRQSRLSSGFAYTYEHYKEPPMPHDFQKCSLQSLDKFLRTKIRLLATSHGLTYMQKRELNRHSFMYGHKNKHKSSFTKSRVLEVRGCWENV
jgi:hypothetical protein